jgi:Sigma-70 region 2
MEEDLKLWRKIGLGDTTAVKALHDKYYYQLYLYGKKICHNSAVLDEVVSDCFIKLWTRRNELLIDRSLKAYLFLMLRNGHSLTFQMMRIKMSSIIMHFFTMPWKNYLNSVVVSSKWRYLNPVLIYK